MSEDDEEGDRTLVLDLIEEELTARGFNASKEHAVDEESTIAQSMEPLPAFRGDKHLWGHTAGPTVYF